MIMEICSKGLHSMVAMDGKQPAECSLLCLIFEIDIDIVGDVH